MQGTVYLVFETWLASALPGPWAGEVVVLSAQAGCAVPFVVFPGCVWRLFMLDPVGARAALMSMITTAEIGRAVLAQVG
jgi:hypothetical protein